VYINSKRPIHSDRVEILLKYKNGKQVTYKTISFWLDEPNTQYESVPDILLTDLSKSDEPKKSEFVLVSDINNTSDLITPKHPIRSNKNQIDLNLGDSSSNNIVNLRTENELLKKQIETLNQNTFNSNIPKTEPKKEKEMLVLQKLLTTENTANEENVAEPNKIEQKPEDLPQETIKNTTTTDKTIEHELYNNKNSQKDNKIQDTSTPIAETSQPSNINSTTSEENNITDNIISTISEYNIEIASSLLLIILSIIGFAYYKKTKNSSTSEMDISPEYSSWEDDGDEDKSDFPEEQNNEATNQDGTEYDKKTDYLEIEKIVLDWIENDGYHREANKLIQNTLEHHPEHKTKLLYLQMKVYQSEHNPEKFIETAEELGAHAPHSKEWENAQKLGAEFIPEHVLFQRYNQKYKNAEPIKETPKEIDFSLDLNEENKDETEIEALGQNYIDKTEITLNEDDFEQEKTSAEIIFGEDLSLDFDFEPTIKTDNKIDESKDINKEQNSNSFQWDIDENKENDIIEEKIYEAERAFKIGRNEEGKILIQEVIVNGSETQKKQANLLMEQYGFI